MSFRASAARTAAVSLSVVMAVTLAGCSPAATGQAAGQPADTTGAGSSTPIAIVASTNVWGDIVAQVGGDRVSVTSLIDDPAKDPHEYEADAQNQLALSKAAIVVENGGGYDDFVDTMIASANNSKAVVLNAAEISGYDLEPSTGEFNEHLWYDFPTVSKVVDQVASSLGSLDAADASTFTANATAFKAKLDALISTENTLKSQYAGRGAAITEPVPLYMLDAIGLVDKTPAEFSGAIESGTDVAPDVLAQTLALFSGDRVSVLAYNSQTSGPQTEAVLAAATAGNVPAVAVTETLPDAMSYIDWMTANLAALSSALSQ
ncbi:metal ABC transporter solute-binding protein, Zn/Mn family [Subtercola boreus]|uniref:ABC transporter substrate-binding protein n=1 Tax=Subtercola boreus TaxID=120213 RepID=A0A3E0WGM9_9MICO|nr:zinc ABC transporter substrate-binding protein [Subtercola boreus]RFA23412.1 ABC transporter substrate-binding protein [Subtercola boreus]RFA23805.1 ABC transporter substrate-binding protein [Subtercola boreus]RFA29506.1 ABC transporter substrate-binding protein [Subtercola boreus]